MKRRLAISLALAAIPAFCTVLLTATPAHAGLFSVSANKEKKIGDEVARELDGSSQIVTGPVADWINIVGQRLASVSNPEFKYSFRVVDDPEINAFTLPGGYIYVFTGLRKVCRDDDELAAVLGHEITHAEQHHYARQQEKTTKRGLLLGILSAVAGLPNVAQQALSVADYALTQKYSRENEYEADRLGMLRMTRAGFNPQAMVSLLDRLNKEAGSTDSLDRWFGDHPDGGRRSRAAQEELAQVKTLEARRDPTVRPVLPLWNNTAPLQELGVTTTPDGN